MLKIKKKHLKYTYVCFGLNMKYEINYISESSADVSETFPKKST
jgi:hypothetical protein